MKKVDQVRLLNRLHRAMQGFNGYDNIEDFGEYSLSNTGRLQYSSPAITVRNIPHSVETQIHVLLHRMEVANK